MERKRWKAGLKLFHQAKRQGTRLPIIFAPAEDVRYVRHWGTIRDLRVSHAGTKYRFAELQRIDPWQPRSALRLEKTGKPIRKGHIRPYVIVRTPDFIEESASGPKADDYVAYHSAKVMGRDYGEMSRHRESWHTGKSETYLTKAIGSRVWVIKGRPVGAKNKYWLCGMFRLETVRPKKRWIEGTVESALRPPIEVTDLPWFKKLLKEQVNFRLGFNRIRDAGIVAELERFLGRPSEDIFRSPDEIATPSQFWEGATRKVPVNYYERNPQAREQCIKHHGCRCAVCGFDFEETYGKIGRGFIHVHNLRPLAEIHAEYKINPVKDLRPICPNCHAMIHSGRQMLEIEELQKVLRT